MKFKTVILCLKLLTGLIVQRSFGSILKPKFTNRTYFFKIVNKEAT